jgi:hypothetical protein
VPAEPSAKSTFTPMSNSLEPFSLTYPLIVRVFWAKAKPLLNSRNPTKRKVDFKFNIFSGL